MVLENEIDEHFAGKEKLEQKLNLNLQNDEEDLNTYSRLLI